MSNLAFKTQQKRYEEQQVVKKKKLKYSYRMTIGEKVIILILSVLFSIGGITVVHNQSAIYQTNNQIQKLQSNIEKQTKTNSGLQEEISKLKNPERILNIAREKGLTINENNILLIQQ